jgi:hypothetical protein
MEKKFKYELTEGVVSFILQALNRVQIAGVQSAQDLISVVSILQEPLKESEELKKPLKEDNKK